MPGDFLWFCLFIGQLAGFGAHDAHIAVALPHGQRGTIRQSVDELAVSVRLAPLDGHALAAAEVGAAAAACEVHRQAAVGIPWDLADGSLQHQHIGGADLLIQRTVRVRLAVLADQILAGGRIIIEDTCLVIGDRFLPLR